MTIQSISALACPVGSHGPCTTIGTAVDQTILSFDQNVIMSYGCGKGAPQPINYADFNTPVPWSIVSRQFDCTLGVLATHHPPWEYDYEYTMRPPLQYPAEIRTAINTDWALCSFKEALADPPYALTPAGALLPSDQTITPVVEPPVGPTADPVQTPSPGVRSPTVASPPSPEPPAPTPPGPADPIETPAPSSPPDPQDPPATPQDSPAVNPSASQDAPAQTQTGDPEDPGASQAPPSKPQGPPAPSQVTPSQKPSPTGASIIGTQTLQPGGPQLPFLEPPIPWPQRMAASLLEDKVGFRQFQ